MLAGNWQIVKCQPNAKFSLVRSSRSASFRSMVTQPVSIVPALVELPIPPAFAAELARLNERQRQAVTHPDGPLLVVAGPGTGKTQLLATRVA